jgi:hypothetical protein
VSRVRNGIVESSGGNTKRIYLEAGPNTYPTRLTYEVTKDADGDCTAELISGDVEALSDLDNEEAEAEAIRMAEAEWAKPAATYADLVRSGVIRHREAIDVEHEGYERALSSLRKYGP